MVLTPIACKHSSKNIYDVLPYGGSACEDNLKYNNNDDNYITYELHTIGGSKINTLLNK